MGRHFLRRAVVAGAALPMQHLCGKGTRVRACVHLGLADGKSNGVNRETAGCEWPGVYQGAHTVAYVAYHDNEWGVPHVDDKGLFEHLTLDGAQSGLSWSTILAKRDNYTRAYKDWDIAAVACMTDADVQRLMLPEAGLVKSERKIKSAIHNAQLVLKVQEEYGSFASYLWSFMPGEKPIINKLKSMRDMPTFSEESTKISKDMKRRGFKFVGPVMVYAMMQAVGMVNDHTIDCYRYSEVSAIMERIDWPLPRCILHERYH